MRKPHEILQNRRRRLNFCIKFFVEKLKIPEFTLYPAKAKRKRKTVDGSKFLQSGMFLAIRIRLQIVLQRPPFVAVQTKFSHKRRGPLCGNRFGAECKLLPSVGWVRSILLQEKSTEFQECHRVLLPFWAFPQFPQRLDVLLLVASNFFKVRSLKTFCSIYPSASLVAGGLWDRCLRRRLCSPFRCSGSSGSPETVSFTESSAIIICFKKLSYSHYLSVVKLKLLYKVVLIAYLFP